eukprot:TRINITY_DN10952_c0_g1_i1.p2 TRINITY_DN10952_c0_g1~~TRINITY_DN10952_c0_g1_i1.p2  ORF type:complete len:217 (+),score=11.04 TRINITY_DN10952_c0_g1_i1:1830-2480(+)
MAQSRGVDFPCQYQQPSIDNPSSKACIHLNERDLAVLRNSFQTNDVRLVISIGAGDGFVEGLLEQYCNVTVVAMDLYSHSDDIDAYEKTTVHVDHLYRVLPHELLDLDYHCQQRGIDYKHVAILLCFGRRLPLMAYLEAFAQLRHVVIIADQVVDGSSIAQPDCNALLHQPSWTLTAKHAFWLQLVSRQLLYSLMARWLAMSIQRGGLLPASMCCP